MLSTSQGSRSDYSQWIVVTPQILADFTGDAFLSLSVLNRPLQFLINVSKHWGQRLHQISADRPPFPLSCGEQPDTTVPGSFERKDNLSSNYTTCERLPAGIRSTNLEVCATCGFQGNTDNEARRFSPTLPHPILFSSKDDPFLDCNLLSSSTFWFLTVTYNRCKTCKFSKSKSGNLAWEEWQ